MLAAVGKRERPWAAARPMPAPAARPAQAAAPRGAVGPDPAAAARTALGNMRARAWVPAQPFAALAYSAITAANISPVTGDVGVSAGAMSNITGFDAPADVKFGTDSLAPDDQRTIVAQQDVTSLVGDIDPRACDVDYTDVVGGPDR